MIVDECARLMDGLSSVSSAGASSSSSAAQATTNGGGSVDHFSQSGAAASGEDGALQEAEYASVGYHDIIVMEVHINHGKDPIDKTVGYPLKHVLFYNPKQPEVKPKVISENSFRAVQLPKSWGQLSFWVYVRAQESAVNHTVAKAWENVQAILRKERKGQSVQSLQNQQSPAHRDSASGGGRRVSRGSTGSGEAGRSEALFGSSMDPIA